MTMFEMVLGIMRIVMCSYNINEEFDPFCTHEEAFSWPSIVEILAFPFCSRTYFQEILRKAIVHPWVHGLTGHYKNGFVKIF